MLVSCDYIWQEISHYCVSELHYCLGERGESLGNFWIQLLLAYALVVFYYLVGHLTCFVKRISRQFNPGEAQITLIYSKRLLALWSGKKQKSQTKIQTFFLRLEGFRFNPCSLSGSRTAVSLEDFKISQRCPMIQQFLQKQSCRC